MGLVGGVGAAASLANSGEIKRPLQHTVEQTQTRKSAQLRLSTRYTTRTTGGISHTEFNKGYPWLREVALPWTGTIVVVNYPSTAAERSPYQATVNAIAQNIRNQLTNVATLFSRVFISNRQRDASFITR